MLNLFFVSFYKIKNEQCHYFFFFLKYIDLVRVIDLNDVKRFKQLAANVDLNEIQLGVIFFIFSFIFSNFILAK